MYPRAGKFVNQRKQSRVEVREDEGMRKKSRQPLNFFISSLSLTWSQTVFRSIDTLLILEMTARKVMD